MAYGVVQSSKRRYAVVQLDEALRATSRKVAGSILDGVTEIFH